MVVVTPIRTSTQRMDALRKANVHRMLRAEMKRGLTVDRAVVLLTDTPEWLETMKVLAFLQGLPKVGRVKAMRLLHVCRISQGKTVAGLSWRQRDELLAEITR